MMGEIGMDISRPATSVVPSLDADVLMVLAGTTRPLTGREVSRLARRGSWSGVRLVLGRLADHGLVDVQEATPSLLYTLNRDHVAAPVVLRLAGIRAEFIRRIREHVRHWEKPPASAAVFGSAARGDGDLESDVDVFVVRPDHVDGEDLTWRTQISDLSAAITRWSGNRASMIDVSVAEARELRARQQPIVRDVVRDALRVAGRPVADIFDGSVS